MELSFGLLIVRIVVGLLMIGHGSQKLFGWFGGPGLKGVTGMLQSMGFKPAGFWAVIGALGEFGGGILLVLGLLTPLGAVAIFASMLMAVLKFHWKAGLWAQGGGYEYPLTLGIVALAGGIIGAGNYSLDALIGFSLPAVYYWVLVVLAVIVDVIGILTSHTVAAPAQQQA
jgi:Predicted membrane protein